MKHVELRLSRCYDVEELYGKYFDCPAPYHNGDCSEECGGFLVCEICLGEIMPMAQYALVGVKGVPICADCVTEFGRDGLCERYSAYHGTQVSRHICKLIRQYSPLIRGVVTLH